jgi:branched-subunit amino acid transport protein
MALWLAIVGIALTGVATRCSFLLLSARLRLSPTIERALRYAPGAALSAIVLPLLLVDHHGTVNIGLSNHEWVASGVAALVMWRWRSMVWSMTVGLVALTALRLFA